MFPLIPIVPTFISTIATAISSISTFVTTYGPTIIRTLQTVHQVIDVCAKILNILKPEESVSDIGAKALQATNDGFEAENFDKYDEYLDYIRSVEVSPEIAEKYTENDKILTGIAITSHAIEEKLGLPTDTMGILCSMVALNPDYFTPSRISSYINTGMDLGKVIAYFTNKLNATESFKTEQSLIKLDESNRPEAEIEQELEQAKTDLYQASRH